MAKFSVTVSETKMVRMIVRRTFEVSGKDEESVKAVAKTGLLPSWAQKTGRTTEEVVSADFIVEEIYEVL